jgi:serine/threonine protein phosphatase PrpC
MNEDHTFLAEAVKHGVLTPEQASRSSHNNVVTRAVGPYPTVQVDTLVFDVLAGDTLLLCSDGLYQHYPNPLEIAETLEKHDIADIPPHLIATANERGGLDNITAIVVRAQLTRDTSLADSKRASENPGAVRDAARHRPVPRNDDARTRPGAALRADPGRRRG